MVILSSLLTSTNMGIGSNKSLIIALTLLLIAGTANVIAAEYDVYLYVDSSTSAVVQWAIPEGRSGASSTNWETNFYITVRTATDGDDVILDSMDELATTTVAGEYLTLIPFNVASGTYDVCIKGWQHLSRKLNDITLVDNATNTLNFTQADNSSSFGPIRLLAGDINDIGNSTTTLGDDVVNSVDLSLLLRHLDQDDATGNDVRENLNQDTVVNSVDLSLLMKNLDVEGDR